MREAALESGCLTPRFLREQAIPSLEFLSITRDGLVHHPWVFIEGLANDPNQNTELEGLEF